MHKKLLLVLFLVSVLALAIGTASAPRGITSLTLAQSAFFQEKGLGFKFDVTGTPTASDLKGWLYIKEKSYKLSCVYKSAQSQIFCTAPAGTAQQAGSYGIVTLAGYSFGVIVPSKADFVLLNKNK
jgi:hypothetical protein